MANYIKNIPKSISKLHSSIYPVYAKGSYIYTGDHNKYLDLTSGIGALSTGHNHPYIKNAVSAQLDKYVHIPQQVFQSHPIQTELTNKILETVPGTDLDSIFYVSSGSEATDNAIKIARKHTGKSNIISMNGGFHGRTIAALSVTSSNLNCRKGLTPLLSNVFFCDECTDESLHKLFEYQTSPDDTAAILLESVQGEGGIKSIEKGFVQHIKEVCEYNNIMLIADEVQCGSMRTGVWWDIIGKDVVPDIMTFGKGIASGYPLAGVISKSEIMDNLGKGYFGGTYGGNGICSAAASATIDILNNPEIVDNVVVMGKYIKTSLENEPLIKEIRQHGLMIGIEFLFNDYNPELSLKLVTRLRDKGILVLVSGNKSQYIRLLPPLNIDQEDIDVFLHTFKKILAQESGIFCR
tara:strand:- start:1944 stop:3167 length:1224 start_codon:yes stop_codon:yes gene_type:complete